MDAIAKTARISRPGLYFLFESKEALFREAASHVLAQDLAAITRVLAHEDRALADRVLDAFDRWAGRYVGPMAWDVPAVIAENPDLLDEFTRAAPIRFEESLTDALRARSGDAGRLAQTLISISTGLIHQVATREAYLARLRVGIELLLR